jgi:hypothetical protein
MSEDSAYRSGFIDVDDSLDGDNSEERTPQPAADVIGIDSSSNNINKSVGRKKTKKKKHRASMVYSEATSISNSTGDIIIISRVPEDTEEELFLDATASYMETELIDTPPLDEDAEQALVDLFSLREAIGNNKSSSGNDNINDSNNNKNSNNDNDDNNDGNNVNVSTNNIGITRISSSNVLSDIEETTTFDTKQQQPRPPPPLQAPQQSTDLDEQTARRGRAYLIKSGMQIVDCLFALLC